jgi:hypothetical protein
VYLSVYLSVCAVTLSIYLPACASALRVHGVCVCVCVCVCVLYDRRLRRVNLLSCGAQRTHYVCVYTPHSTHPHTQNLEPEHVEILQSVLRRATMGGEGNDGGRANTFAAQILKSTRYSGIS